jgi:hypothetical protein
LGRLAGVIAKELLQGQKIVSIFVLLYYMLYSFYWNHSTNFKLGCCKNRGSRYVWVSPKKQGYLSVEKTRFKNLIVIFEWYLRKRFSTNPRRGPFHYRAPSKFLWRAVKGMLPRKTQRGKEALARLTVFEGNSKNLMILKSHIILRSSPSIRQGQESRRSFCFEGHQVKARKKDHSHWNPCLSCRLETLCRRDYFGSEEKGQG